MTWGKTKAMQAVSSYLLVGLGGALGAITRYVIGVSIHVRAGSAFAWGTLTVNILGCLLMGIVLGIGMQANSRFFLLFAVGFLGSLTTFSAFSAESLRYFADGKYLLLFWNVAANLFGSLLAAWLGLFLAMTIGGSMENRLLD
ncbi:MAG TPA: CrcB family protein [Pirellulaceae bacterium]|nr:CrcB family protein [Pirellulaceae bacterium]HMO93171.1 CrcB family protein [Pirellulaceae bacterium]HMP70000.1 CrcB family protein [Pirellulaceae bacterium]